MIFKGHPITPSFIAKVVQIIMNLPKGHLVDSEKKPDQGLFLMNESGGQFLFLERWTFILKNDIQESKINNTELMQANFVPCMIYTLKSLWGMLTWFVISIHCLVISRPGQRKQCMVWISFSFWIQLCKHKALNAAQISNYKIKHLLPLIIRLRSCLEAH